MRLTNIYLIKSKKARICVIWLQMVAIGLSLRRYYQLLCQDPLAGGSSRILPTPLPASPSGGLANTLLCKKGITINTKKKNINKCSLKGFN